MIYLDLSVVLAYLLGEDRSPPDSLWQQALISSRLLEYEVWNCIHAYRLADLRGEAARQLIDRLDFVELSAEVLARALQPFPIRIRIRTLDALHLASIAFLRSQRQPIDLLSYDKRMLAAAHAMQISFFEH